MSAAGSDSTRGWLTLPPGSEGDETIKPLSYLPVYEELLAPLRHQEFCLLEMGVWKGDSLEMWRDSFPAATIVGLDLTPPDVSLGPRVHVVAGDQSDRRLLDRVRADYAPDGFDVVIDDASHFGELTARSVQAIFPDHLKPAGLYVIEDWGTGYWSDWEDGAAPAAVVSVDQLAAHAANEAVAAGLLFRRSSGVKSTGFPSHDAGMVGVVKRLVDHVGSGDISSHEPEWVRETLAIEWMRIHHGLVILKKKTEGAAVRT